MEARKPGEVWHIVQPTEVLAQGEEIRFRVQAPGPWRLYLLYEGSSGASGILFPSVEAGKGNLLTPGQPLLIPEDGAFEISGPPGEDVLYWVFTPAVAPAPRALPHTLLPRCDDAMFSSGPRCGSATPSRQMRETRRIADNAERKLEMKARDLKIVRPSPPTIIELRIRHR